jgi:hypothetical protein
LPSLLHNLLAEVHSVDESFRKRAGIAWYRGHCSADWELTSTLHRHIEWLTGRLRDPPNHRSLLRDEYKTLYRQFKSEAWPLLGPSERTEWGIIFAMQHYGFPTRLLDWTESFGCALYFAQHGRERGRAAAIWALNPEHLNQLSIHQNGIVGLDEITTLSDVPTNGWHPRYKAPKTDLPTIAVSPVFSNARMTAQRSKFTLSGDSFKPLNKQLQGLLVREGALVKLEVPAECFDEVEDFLRVAGLRAFSFMPDMEGLLREHKARIAKSLADSEKYFPDEFKTRPG